MCMRNEVTKRELMHKNVMQKFTEFQPTEKRKEIGQSFNPK